MADIASLLAQGRPFNFLQNARQFQAMDIANQQAKQQQEQFDLNKQLTEAKLSDIERQQIQQLDAQKKAELSKKMDALAFTAKQAKNKDQLVSVLQNFGVAPDKELFDNPNIPYEVQQAAVIAKSDNALKYLSKQSAAGGGKEVQKSEMLPGGITRIVYKDGSIETKKSTEANQQLIKDAEMRGARLQGIRAGERTQAGIAGNVVKDSFAAFSKIQKNISNYNEGVKILDSGAKTGPVQKFLPSVRATAQEFKNLQNRLGLDIIGAVTFGALSEGELNLALDTALPTGLPPKELRAWIIDHRDAQVKLANYLNDQVQFLGTPGNKVSDWLALKETQSKLDEMQNQFQSPNESTKQQTGQGTAAPQSDLRGYEAYIK